MYIMSLHAIPLTAIYLLSLHDALPISSGFLTLNPGWSNFTPTVSLPLSRPVHDETHDDSHSNAASASTAHSRLRADSCRPDVITVQWSKTLAGKSCACAVVESLKNSALPATSP